MAAGLGFKDFATGEVLTAGDVDGYLMQGIWVFASAAARDAAVTSPQEGNFAFTKDTNGLWYYDGAAWVASGATGDIEGVTAGIGISGGGTSGTVTVTNSMATAIDAKGDLVVGTGADTFSKLTVGANGTTLVADSAETTGLKWATPAAGGGITLLSTTTLSGSSTSVTGISSSYKDLRILLYGVNASSGGTLTIQLNGSNSVSYTNQVMRLTTAPILEQLYAGNWRLNGNGLGSASASNCFALTVSNYANDGGSTVKPYFYFGGYTDDGPRSSPIFGGGYWEDTTAVSSFNVAIAAGSFSAGTIKVYGVN